MSGNPFALESAAEVYALTHQGDSNFIVTAYDEDGASTGSELGCGRSRRACRSDPPRPNAAKDELADGLDRASYRTASSRPDVSRSLQ